MSKVFTITDGLENMGALRTGGQGSVYKAKRVGSFITAVKLLPTPIHTEDMEDKNFRNFQNEVEKLKKVNEVPSANIVKILSSGITESGSLPFIEMEFIEGPDLEELLNPPHEQVFTVKEAIKVAEQLASALSHCHRLGIKHGDIKSNNIKYNIQTGNYILLDFGMAIMTEEQRRTSLKHAGAIEFMAPEQNDGEMLLQTDIYSYGVVMYELLTGQVPFPLNGNSETSRNTVMVAHMEKPVPDLLNLRKQNQPANWTAEVKNREMQVPLWLLNVIAKCLEKLPENRFLDGHELQTALNNGGITTAPITEVDRSEINRLEKENGRLNALVLNNQSSNTRSNSVLPVDFSNGFQVHAVSIAISKTLFKVFSIVFSILFVFTVLWFSAKKASTAAITTTQDTLKNSATDQDSTFDNKPKPGTKGKTYHLAVSQVYLYDQPDINSISPVYLEQKNDAGVEAVDETTSFVYIELTDKDNNVTKGWLRKADLKE
ncbi:serine/threonine-protein kinase [Mucilaginibacter sp.]|uniref:serine/threonine protein kinase n=1 Tax=Mucilaginibacter sp. TaxID=1882438 RepID=UPI003264D93C